MVIGGKGGLIYARGGIPKIPNGSPMGKELIDEMLNRSPSMVLRDFDSVHLKRVPLCKEILHDGLKIKTAQWPTRY